VLDLKDEFSSVNESVTTKE